MRNIFIIPISLLFLIGVYALPEASAWTYVNDAPYKFSIDIPNGWIVDDSLDFYESGLKISDKYDWTTNIYVWYFDNMEVSSSDQQELNFQYELEQKVCDGLSFRDDGMICYDFQKLDEFEIRNEINGYRSITIFYSSTFQWDDPNFPGEYPMVGSTTNIYNGNDIWQIVSETDESEFNYDRGKIIGETVGSFSLEQVRNFPTSTQTSENIIKTATGSDKPGCEPNCYYPNVMRINVGETVTWESPDSGSHTITSGTVSEGPDRAFDSGITFVDYSVSFPYEGTYPYFCIVHPWKAGTIIVGDGSSTSTQTIPAQPAPTSNIPSQPTSTSSSFGSDYTTESTGHLRNTTWYYYVDSYPSWFPNSKQVVQNGINFWKNAAPGINFVQVYSENELFSKNNSLLIDFVKEFGREHIGHAIDGWFIEIGMGDSDCTGTWTPYSTNYASTIAAHEIGHVLGFDHVNDSQSIMYPIALNSEYGVIEYTTNLTSGYAYFAPVCTIKYSSTFDWHVSSNDPVYGFDAYFVPSINEMEKWEQNQDFDYYSSPGCSKNNMISVGGTCSNVSDESGMLVIMGDKVSEPLTEITITLQENSGQTNIISDTPSSGTSFSSPDDSDIFVPTETSLYVDEQGRFSIEYPQGWFIEKGTGVSTTLGQFLPLVTFYDGEEYYNSKIEVYNFEGYNLEYSMGVSNPTDQEIFDFMKSDDERYCSENNFKENGLICYNFTYGPDGQVYYTDYNVKGYSVLNSYTIQFEDDPTEYDVVTTTSEITIGNDGWQIFTETDDEDFGDYLEILAKSTKSLHVERISMDSGMSSESPLANPIPLFPIPSEPELTPSPSSTSSKYGNVMIQQEIIKVGYQNQNVKVSGQIFGEISRGDKVHFVFTKPDGTTDGQSVFPTEDGFYETFVIINDETPLGNHEIMVTSKGKVVGFVNFEVTDTMESITPPASTPSTPPPPEPTPPPPELTSPPPASTPTPASTPSTSNGENICGEGTILRDGVCVAACGEGTVFKDGKCEIIQPTSTVQSAPSTSSEGGGCLIATAAFGSEMAPQVQLLRELRDNTILQTTSGTTFMNGFNHFYYSFSPAVADYERENAIFKEMVKVSLTPMLTSLTLLNYVEIDSEEEMLGYGIGIILLNIGMYFVAPAIIIVSLKKRLFS